jgi:hypothetical protein
MSIRLESLLLAAALALVSGIAFAQFLYKSTMPDGKVMFGDAPMPGAVKVEKTKPDTSKKGVTAVTPKEAETLRKQAEKGAAGPEQERVAQLEAALRKMEAAREKAKEPAEGSQERLKMYDQGVAALRKELERARAGK